MSSVNDPCGEIVALMIGEWDEETGGKRPVIDKAWYSGVHDKVVASDGKNRTVRHVTLKEVVASHLVSGGLVETVELEAQLDIWAQSEADVLQMRDEVKRILRYVANEPAAGIDFITNTAWRDTSAFDAVDGLYRMTASIVMEYEEE